MRASDSVVRSTAFQFTINNYTQDDINRLQDLYAQDKVRKLIVGKETGKQGTPHLQGYIQFDKRQVRRNVEIWLGGRAHLEQAARSPQENYRYCTKEGSILFNKGFDMIMKDMQKQEQARQKKDQAAAAILSDIFRLTEAQFIQAHTHFYLYRNREYRAFKAQADQYNLINYSGELREKNYWIFGSSGIGKSKLADQWAEPNKILRKTNNKWFDGYTPDLEIVIVDDITPNLHVETARTIKNLADRYKFVVEVKNGVRVISPADYCLIITSNYTIEQVFPNVEDHEPIRRRFSIINADDAQRLHANIDPPPYLEILRKKRSEILELPVAEAIKRIGEEAREREQDPLEQAVQELNRKIHESQTHKRKNRDTQSQRKKTQVIHQEASSDSDIPTPLSSDGEDPHPVFQGKQTQNWITPTQEEVADFSDQSSSCSDTEDPTQVDYDPQRNHSQYVGDPLLEALQDEEESSDSFSFEYSD